MKYKLVSLVCLIIGLMTYGCTHTVNILDRPISFDEEIILLDKYLPVIEYHSCEDFLAIPFALYLRTETIAYNEFWKNYDTKFYLYESIGESIEVLVDSNSIFLLTDLSHSASINEIKRLIDINICEYPDNETQSSYSTSEEYYDENGNTYVTNNYYSGDNYDFEMDDYYDYSYSARLRRFYNPCYGYGYYSTYYTNSYWYSYNPFQWGVSIYLGYNWWPSFHTSFSWHHPNYYGYGWGNNYNSHHHHNYSYGYGSYNNYGSGYNYGYNGSYWDGYSDGYYNSSYNPYYYNSYDATSSYYGPRKSVSTNSRATSQKSLAYLYVKET